MAPPSKDDQTAELIHKVTDNVSGGGSGGGLVVHITNDTLDKTWQEVYDATAAGIPLVIVESLNPGVATTVSIKTEVALLGEDAYMVGVCVMPDAGSGEFISQSFFCSSPDEYPQAVM